MCLPGFQEFRDLQETEAIVGYRNWRNTIKPRSLDLRSEYENYTWKVAEGQHEVKEKDSGLYSYNNYYRSYDNNNNYHFDNNNYYNYNYYNNYRLRGIILQWGKVAIHKIGYRSEYARVKTLFTIRESDAEGPDKFLSWVKSFNILMEEIAKKYNANTIHWQDFIETKEIRSV